MKRIMFAVLAAASLAGPAVAGGWNDYSGGGWGYGQSNSGQQWGQVHNGFGGGEEHRCVTTCTRDGRRCETHCY